jgi:cytochrome P450
VASAIVRLLEHPGQLGCAVRDVARWPEVVEEALRFDSVVQASTARYVQQDVTIGATRIASGSVVLMSIAAANRDPARFENPERFDIDRPRRPHLGFGHGIHFCLGAYLGRAEVAIALSTLFEALPDIRLAVPADQIRWTFGPMMRGPAAVPVTFSRAPTGLGE